MIFRLLGPVEIIEQGRARELAGPKLRCVLATLLLEPGRVVSRQRLYAAVWGSHFPDTARKAIQVYISQLRSVLADVPDVALTRRGEGYLIDLDPDRVDLHRFRRLAAAGRDRESLTAALALWRGPALSGIGDCPLRTSEAPRLQEERLDALERRIALDLEAGSDPTAIPELLEICNEEPYRETTRGLLMRALATAGRLGEALAVYRDVRRLLIEELGTEPSGELAAIHQELLIAQAIEPDSNDAAGGVAGAGDADRGPSGSRGPLVPAQLPAETTHFIGRESEVAGLASGLDASPTRGLRIALITGYGGVGKTELALRTAHQVRARFDDGQLFATLRGTGDSPALPSDVLEGFLRALGVNPDRLPPSLADRAALFRSLVADRRVLIVLDDAASAAQVRPLLPGTGSCAVVVTSRRGLPGLEIERTVEVDELPPDRAVELLARMVGPGRARAEPEAAESIVRCCGLIPLAVRVAGGRLASHPEWSLEVFSKRLRSESPLDELYHGDLAVRNGFELSYRHLGATEARAFRLLAVAGVPELPLGAACSLLGLSRRVLEPVLAGLVDLSLLQEPAPGRYRYHDLMHSFALERSEAEDDPRLRDSTLVRAFGFYSSSAVNALNTLIPQLRLVAPELPDGDTEGGVVSPTTFTDSAEAADWLAAEHVTVTDVALRLVDHEDAARRPGALAPVAMLNVYLGNYVELGGPWEGWERLSRRLLEIAERNGDGEVERRARVVLAGLMMRRGEADEAARLLAPALRDASDRGDGGAQGRLLAMLGVAYREAGRPAEASQRLQESARAHRRARNHRGYAMVLIHQADLDNDQGRYRHAIRRAATVLRIERRMESPDPLLRMSAHEALGDGRAGLGEATGAIETYERALALASRHASRSIRQRILPRLADAYERVGQPERAAELRRTGADETAESAAPDR